MILVAIAAATASASAGTPGPEFFVALRAADTRLAAIAERLATANVAMCDRRSPALGMVLHGIRQYRPSARAAARMVFNFIAPVSVEAVVPGSGAERGGVVANDGLLAIGGQAFTVSTDMSTLGSEDRDRAVAALDVLAPDQPITLTMKRGQHSIDLTVVPRAACRSHFEIVMGKGFDAQADGIHVQLGEKFFEGLSDEEIAVVVAHELAHNILHHRDRLDAARVSWGLASEFGRSARLFRETEDQADALSVYVLENAGYDPFAPGRFWRAYANKVSFEGILRSRTHSSGKARARAMDAIAATISPGAARPIVPSLVSTRDWPLN